MSRIETHETRAMLRLDAFLPYRLSITSNLVSDQVATTYRTLFDLSVPEWRLIAVVAEAEDGITQAAIGVKTRMDKVSVSRAATALTKRGLLARSGNPGDGRSHLLVLSEPGRTLYEAVAPKALELERQIFASFSAGELAAFTDMLLRIDAIILAQAD